MLQRVAEDTRLECGDVGGDVGEFGHVSRIEHLCGAAESKRGVGVAIVRDEIGEVGSEEI